jgi:thioredoxin 1
MPANIPSVTQDNIDEYTRGPSLVDFSAAWCPPCKILDPIIEKLSAEYAGRVKIGKNIIDDSPEVAQRYGVTGAPTLVFINCGRVVDVHIGVLNEQRLRERLDNMLAVTC